MVKKSPILFAIFAILNVKTDYHKNRKIDERDAYERAVGGCSDLCFRK